MNQQKVSRLQRASTLLFALAVAHTALAFIVPFEFYISLGGLFALAGAGFGLRWYAEVLLDREAQAEAKAEADKPESTQP